MLQLQFQRWNARARLTRSGNTADKWRLQIRFGGSCFVTYASTIVWEILIDFGEYCGRMALYSKLVLAFRVLSLMHPPPIHPNMYLVSMPRV